MIRTTALSYRYPGSPMEFEFPDIFCGNGEALLLTGASGSGKTTLLSLVGGLKKQNSGTIVIDSTNLDALSTSELDKFRGAQIGFVFQQHYFIESISVWQNLALARKVAGKKVGGEIDELLKELGIAHKAKDLPSKLSVGERQRLAIARALVNEPAVVLADEPTSALDNKNCEAVVNLLMTEAKLKNTSLIVVTHDDRLKQQFSNQISL